MGFALDLANVSAHHGVAQSITGIVIVFFALSAIALLISLMPRVMKVLAKYIPEEAPVVKKRAKKTDSDEAVAVAIAVSHHTNSNK